MQQPLIPATDAHARIALEALKGRPATAVQRLAGVLQQIDRDRTLLGLAPLGIENLRQVAHLLVRNGEVKVPVTKNP